MITVKWHLVFVVVLLRVEKPDIIPSSPTQKLIELMKLISKTRRRVKLE